MERLITFAIDKDRLEHHGQEDHVCWFGSYCMNKVTDLGFPLLYVSIKIVVKNRDRPICFYRGRCYYGLQ